MLLDAAYDTEHAAWVKSKYNAKGMRYKGLLTTKGVRLQRSMRYQAQTRKYKAAYDTEHSARVQLAQSRRIHLAQQPLGASFVARAHVSW